MPAITSTQGASYEAADAGQNSANLQTAIDGVSAAGGGAVFVWEDLWLEGRIYLRSYVLLDFQEHVITLVRDETPGARGFMVLSGCRFTQVRNVTVIPPIAQVVPIILLETTEDPDGHETAYNLIENVRIQNLLDINDQGSYPAHFHDGIVLWAGPGGVIRANRFEQVVVSGVKAAIKLHRPAATSTSGVGGTISDNLFSNIFADGFMGMVLFVFPTDVASAEDVHIDRNLFTHVRGRADTYSLYGFSHIAGIGNHFDHCSIEDWDKARDALRSPYDWDVSEMARSTYICAHDMANVRDRTVGFDDLDGITRVDTIYDPVLPAAPITADRPHLDRPSRPKFEWKSGPSVCDPGLLLFTLQSIREDPS